MSNWLKHGLTVAAIAALAACGGGQDSGAPSTSTDHQAAAPAALKPYALSDAASTARLDPRLARLSGSVRVWVTLEDEPVARYKTQRLQALGAPSQRAAAAQRMASANAAALKADVLQHRAMVMAKQSSLASRLQGFGAKELARAQTSLNGIAVRVDASQLKAIAALPGVKHVRQVRDLHYADTSAAQAQALGAAAAAQASTASVNDGAGVRIAILDSGIDYTHANLGGAGTAAAYEAAYGTDPSDARNTTRDGLFPTAKVIEGYDFVGEDWPNSDEAPDEDPIDFEGHGTHVADIAAGLSADGTHKGIAPGAKLLAVKVCSAVATSCSGIGIIEGFEYALDPDGDGDPADAVDVINLSLGSSFGQEEDDSAYAASVAVELGVVVVAAAGNSGDIPYVVSSPSIAPGALSVAQTTMPYDKAYPLVLTAPSAIAGSYPDTATVDWAPLGAPVSGTMVFVGNACPGDTLLAPPAGKIALINRGVCNVSSKVDVVAKAGAVGAVIAMITDGSPVSFSQGGGDTFVPTMVIRKSLADTIRAQTSPVTAVLSAANGISLAGSMVNSSARGPSYSLQTIKPEIGAPGATISAVAGSGSGTEAFGGTSGATPYVAGSAALVVQRWPDLTPVQIKAMLMNSASTDIYVNRVLFPDELAPVSRIGAGEVRASAALALSGLAYNPDALSGALSFGFQNVSRRNHVVTRTLKVENLASVAKTYSVIKTFREHSDATSGAVRLELPNSITVPPHGSKEVTVKMTIDGSRLQDWTIGDGPNTGDADLLTAFEYDGSVILTAGGETLSIPWHVLPRKSADLYTDKTYVKRGQSFMLHNVGIGQGAFEPFALTGTSSNDGYESTPGSNFAPTDLRAVGVRLVESEYLQFAVSTFGRRSTPVYPAGIEVDIDVDHDGEVDFIVQNEEDGGFGASGRALVWVYDLKGETASAYFYEIADLYSGNAVLTLPVAALGVSASTPLDFSVYVYDNYYTGFYTDAIEGMTYTPAKPRYTLNGVPPAPLAPRSYWTMGTSVVPGGAAASPSQKGFLLLYSSDVGSEADVVRVGP